MAVHCAVNDCDRKILSYKADLRGLCRSHHIAMKRYGTTENQLENGFWRLVDKESDPSGCWLWIGGTCSSSNGQKYGKFHNHLTHRLSYQFANGDIPAELQVDHTCHNTLCVKPNHLRLVTGKQNKENRKGAHGRSGIRGVRLDRGRWRAYIVHNRKYIHIGYFDTAEQADEAARLKRLKLFTHNDIDRRAESLRCM